MPNHCTNQVTLKCRTQEVAIRVKAHLAGKESLFDFNTLMPEPQDLLESTDDPELKASRVPAGRYVDFNSSNDAEWQTGRFYPG
jgi:hypothetical protein